MKKCICIYIYERGIRKKAIWSMMDPSKDGMPAAALRFDTCKHTVMLIMREGEGEKNAFVGNVAKLLIIYKPSSPQVRLCCNEIHRNTRRSPAAAVLSNLKVGLIQNGVIEGCKEAHETLRKSRSRGGGPSVTL